MKKLILKSNSIKQTNVVVVTLLATILMVSGCINFGAGNVKDATSTKSTSKSTSTKTGPSFFISTVQVTAATGPSGASGVAQPPTLTLVFNATTTSAALTDVCQLQSNQNNNNAARSCKCHFEWDENNASSASSFTRIAETAPTQIWGYQLQCLAPDVYDSEIPLQTTVRLSLVPDTNAGNTSGFSTNIYGLVKNATTVTGDFRDAEGRVFRNIYHYSCYDKPQKTTFITRAVGTYGTNQATNRSVGGSKTNDFTVSASASGFSGQSYYYDYYIRSNEIGSIDSGNAAYTCPQVNINGTPSFYPLDTTFSLALQTSASFPIGITAPITISSAGILGYAAKTNADGTCPTFLDSSGRTLRTFRLRQYTALYPIRYSADGDIFDQAQPQNTVYVLDRPVDKSGQDASKPITRLGPKPCPFSFKTQQFGQKCSTDATLNGWNIDGTQIDGSKDCPIYPPPPDQYLKSDGTFVIRPYRPFLANFLENTKFKACAFTSSNPVDPEIVVVHDDNVYSTATGPNDFYCARHYPATGAMLPPPGGDPFDRAPGQCALSDEAAAIKSNKGYACSRTYDPTNSPKNTPSAGCCQVCSGLDCTAVGGGTTAAGRNAAFSPPANTGNPAQASKALPRARPNIAGGGGCFDPSED